MIKSRTQAHVHTKSETIISVLFFFSLVYSYFTNEKKKRKEKEESSRKQVENHIIAVFYLISF